MDLPCLDDYRGSGGELVPNAERRMSEPLWSRFFSIVKC
jgi:hypothetical protein